LGISKWVDNIEMDLGETGWGVVDWIGLTQDRDQWRALVKEVMNVPLASCLVLSSIIVRWNFELV
jgi:hypothetical protein